MWKRRLLLITFVSVCGSLAIILAVSLLPFPAMPALVVQATAQTVDLYPEIDTATWIPNAKYQLWSQVDDADDADYITASNKVSQRMGWKFAYDDEALDDKQIIQVTFYVRIKVSGGATGDNKLTLVYTTDDNWTGGQEKGVPCDIAANWSDCSWTTTTIPGSGGKKWTRAALHAMQWGFYLSTISNEERTIAVSQVYARVEYESGSTTITTQPNANGWMWEAWSGTPPALAYKPYEQVNDDNDATYIAATLDETDAGAVLFAFPGAGLDDCDHKITKVDVTVRAKMGTGSSGSLKLLYVDEGASSPAIHEAATISVNTTAFSDYVSSFSTNPTTSKTWMATQIDNMQWGLRVDGSTSDEVQVARIAATVYYEPAGYYVCPASGADDAHEVDNGTTLAINSTDGTMTVGNDASGNPTYAAVRFTDVPIDWGHVITETYLQLYVTTNDVITVEVFSEDVPASGTLPNFGTNAYTARRIVEKFPDEAGYLSGYCRDTYIRDDAESDYCGVWIQWEIPDTNGATQVITSPNLALLVQEQIGSTNWNSGGDLVFLIRPKDNYAGRSATIQAYDAGDIGKVARLKWVSVTDGVVNTAPLNDIEFSVGFVTHYNSDTSIPGTDVRTPYTDTRGISLTLSTSYGNDDAANAFVGDFSDEFTVVSWREANNCAAYNRGAVSEIFQIGDVCATSVGDMLDDYPNIHWWTNNNEPDQIEGTTGEVFGEANGDGDQVPDTLEWVYIQGVWSRGVKARRPGDVAIVGNLAWGYDSVNLIAEPLFLKRAMDWGLGSFFNVLSIHFYPAPSCFDDIEQALDADTHTDDRNYCTSLPGKDGARRFIEANCGYTDWRAKGYYIHEYGKTLADTSVSEQKTQANWAYEHVAQLVALAQGGMWYRRCDNYPGYTKCEDVNDSTLYSLKADNNNKWRGWYAMWALGGRLGTSVGTATKVTTGLTAVLSAATVSGTWQVYKFTPTSTWGDTGTTEDRFVLWTTDNGSITWNYDVQIIPAEVAQDTQSGSNPPGWATCYQDDNRPGDERERQCYWGDTHLYWADWDSFRDASAGGVDYKLAPGSNKAVLVKKPS